MIDLELAKKVYKKTLGYEIGCSYLNEDGCAVVNHSDKYMDEHPNSDRVDKVYDYNHLFSKFLRSLKNRTSLIVSKDEIESSFKTNNIE